MKTPSTPRPYWHVDLKWIFGIIFALGLWLALTLYVLATLTSERIAVPVATQIAATIVSKNGLDDPADVEALKQKAQNLPGDSIETLPGIFVTKADLATLSPRDLRLKIFSQVVTPYYELGAKGVAAKQSSDPQEQAKLEQQVGFLGLLNQSTHNTLQKLLVVSIGLLVIPLAGLIYFSAGFGRLVSPGLIMAVSTFPAAIVRLILEIATHSTRSAGDGTSAIPGLSPESFELMIRALLPGFLIVFATGAVLLLAAAIGKAVSRHQAPAH